MQSTVSVNMIPSQNFISSHSRMSSFRFLIQKNLYSGIMESDLINFVWNENHKLCGLGHVTDTCVLFSRWWREAHWLCRECSLKFILEQNWVWNKSHPWIMWIASQYWVLGETWQLNKVNKALWPQDNWQLHSSIPLYNSHFHTQI